MDTTDTTDQTQGATPRRATSRSEEVDFWVQAVERVSAGAPPSEAPNSPGRGRASPPPGFGKLWQRTYRARLSGTSEQARAEFDTDGLSLTVTTPGGRSFTGFNTLAVRADGEELVIEITALERSSDPLSELGLALGLMHRLEDRFWARVLRAVAVHFASEPPSAIEMRRVVVDPRRQWRHWRSLGQNAALRSALDAGAGPWRWFRPLKQG